MSPNSDGRQPLRQGRFAILAQIASLVFTGWMIWTRSVSPRLHFYSWATLIGSALGYTIFAGVASAAITGGLLMAVPRRERGDIVWETLRTSLVGAWFAPAILLMSQSSPAALAAALVLVVTTTRLLYSEWRRLHPPEEPLPVWVPTDPMFGEADQPRPPFLQELTPALAIAASAQLGLAAYSAHARFLAAAIFALSAALLTMLAVSVGLGDSRRPENLPRSALGIILTILLAAGLTVGGLRGRVVSGDRLTAGGGGEPGSLPPGDPNAPPGTHTPAPPPGMPPPGTPPALAASAADGTYPGVILQPEAQKVPMLVAPLPPGGGLYHDARREFSIPFEGEYWMYRFLYRRPPPNSYFRKGTPAELSFRTPDHWPLMMEAHQKLDQPIDLGACAMIQVRLWNADAYPGTVSLEMQVVGTDESGRHSQSLGVAPVRSTPDLKKEPVLAVEETLEFPLSAAAARIRCDEMSVTFRRDSTRIDKSAKIAIDRFMLVPR